MEYKTAIMYGSRLIYKVINERELKRYTVLERLDKLEFYVLHADWLRVNDRSDDAFLANLTIELLLELEPESVHWSPTPEMAVLSFEEDFGD